MIAVGACGVPNLLSSGPTPWSQTRPLSRWKRRRRHLPAGLQPIEKDCDDRRPAVFPHFDGALSDIVRERPEAATLVDGAASVAALAAQCPVAAINGAT